jgi:hypothetical protein
MLPGKIPLVVAIILTALACQTANILPVGETARLEVTPVRGYIIELPANQGWSSTGVHFQARQAFQIAYLSGQIRDGATAIADASGTGYVCGHAGCCEPLPEVPRDALIGRIGRDNFYVGNGGAFTAAKSGLLYLRINDCDEGLYENQGSLRIIILP